MILMPAEGWPSRCWTGAPTAVIGTTDIAAIGAIHAAIGMGLSVPGDVSVIGFDDLPAARYVLPALTTVAQPLREIGVWRWRSLCADGGGIGYLQELPLRLVLRDTTARLVALRVYTTAVRYFRTDEKF